MHNLLSFDKVSAIANEGDEHQRRIDGVSTMHGFAVCDKHKHGALCPDDNEEFDYSRSDVDIETLDSVRRPGGTGWHATHTDSADDLHFELVSCKASYVNPKHYNRQDIGNDEVPLVRLYGITTDGDCGEAGVTSGRKIAVNVHGFHPYLYLRPPEQGAGELRRDPTNACRNLGAAVD